MTILPRAATVGELASIRTDGQSSRLYMTVHQPATIYTARLAAVPTSNDNLGSITYNSGSGTHTNILADMTLYVGTSAGAYDLGMVRIRNTTGIGATSGTFNIGMTSEIAWASNAYLTVVDEFQLWPRWPRISSGGTIYMDYDVAYANQHRYCKSFPIFPRVAVKWLPAGGTVTVIRDGSQSWTLNNTINAYTWAAPGSSGLSGGSTNTATITYNAKSPTAGYRVQLTVGNTDAVDSIGYGRVFVLQEESDAITQFTVSNLSGSLSEGGWSCNVTCYAEAGLTQVRDRAMVILHRKDFYGNTQGSIGYVANDENIELVGWIDGDTIKWGTDDAYGSVTFKVVGPQVLLDKLTMPTVGLKNLNKHPSNWKRFQGLTAKSAIWHILMWRTTAPVMMDCFPIDSAVAALQLQSGGAQTVWSQVSSILNDFLLAAPCCDAYGRLFLQREQQCLSLTDRSAIPTVATLTKADWSNDITFERRELNKIAGVDLTGEVYNGTNVTTPLYTLAPGRTFQHRGTNIFSRMGLVVLNQAELNALGGAILGWQNNPYPNWRLQLPSNFHLCDIAPYQYLGLSVAASDTPRGVTLNNLRVIPRSITRNYTNGVFKTEVTVEAESAIGLSVTGDTPTQPPAIPITPPPPPVIPPPDPIPTPSGNARELWLSTTTKLAWSSDAFNGGEPTFTAVSPLPMTGGHTIYSFDVATDGTAAYLMESDNLTVWKLDNIADIRAVPATPAVWTAILTIGDALGYGNYSNLQTAFHIWGTHLIGMVGSTTGRRVHSDYNGTAWTFYNPPANYYDTVVGTAKDYVVRFGFIAPIIYRCPRHTIGDGADIAVYGGVPAETGGAEFVWQASNTSTVAYYMFTRDGDPIPGQLSLQMHRISGSTDTAVAYLSQGVTRWGSFARVYGAWNGIRVWVQNPNDSQLFVSDDGTTWAGKGANGTWTLTWPGNPDLIMNAASAGFGTFVWVRGRTAAFNEIMRYSLDDFATAPISRSGNWWVDIQPGGGEFVLAGGGLVYV